MLSMQEGIVITKVTISAKVPSEMVKLINQTGFATSDVMKVGIEMFLNLPHEQKDTLMWDHIQRKKRERAMARSGISVKKP